MRDYSFNSLSSVLRQYGADYSGIDSEMLDTVVEVLVEY